MTMHPPNLRILSSIAEGDPHFDMSDPQSDVLLEQAEDRHFWHRSRNRFIVDRLHELGISRGARFLEIGCGGGVVAGHLQHEGFRVVGIEGHVRLAQRAARRAPHAQFIVHDLSRGTAPLEQDGSFDAVGLFDVLEHLDDPAQAIREALRCCRIGGYVVATVPAQQALWSVVDEVAGHRLRYNRRDLQYLLKRFATESKICQLRDFNRLLVPFMWIQRRRIQRSATTSAKVSEGNLAIPTAPINMAMYISIRAEHLAGPIVDRLPIPGASLWFAIEKLR